jgi:hypothetical protein
VFTSSIGSSIFTGVTGTWIPSVENQYHDRPCFCVSGRTPSLPKTYGLSTSTVS